MVPPQLIAGATDVEWPPNPPARCRVIATQNLALMQAKTPAPGSFIALDRRRQLRACHAYTCSPYVTVGVALAGAAILVANPIVPAPADIRVPADGQPVELTAITNPPVLGAILLEIQRNQIIDAIEIRNGLTTGAILILNPLLATPALLAAALAEDVQNGEFEAFPAAIVGQTGAIGLGITRSIEVALPPILASAVSNIADTVEGVARLSRRGRRHRRNGDTGSADAGKRCGRSRHRRCPNRRRRRVRPGARGGCRRSRDGGAGNDVRCRGCCRPDRDVAGQHPRTGPPRPFVDTRRRPATRSGARRHSNRGCHASPRAQVLVRNSFKAVVGGSGATAEADGAADRATRVTAPGERLQSAVNKVQQRVKQAVDNVSKRVSGEKPSNESGSENADEWPLLRRLHPFAGVADDADRHRAGQADVLHARSRARRSSCPEGSAAPSTWPTTVARPRRSPTRCPRGRPAPHRSSAGCCGRRCR